MREHLTQRRKPCREKIADRVAMASRLRASFRVRIMRRITLCDCRGKPDIVRGEHLRRILSD
jgi:hypothetical protein